MNGVRFYDIDEIICNFLLLFGNDDGEIDEIDDKSETFSIKSVFCFCFGSLFYVLLSLVFALRNEGLWMLIR